jgi:hypothetical protein
MRVSSLHFWCVVVVAATVIWLSGARQSPAETIDGRQVLDFTWAPTSPEIGESVVSEIIGVPAADIDGASWSFGGVGCDGSSTAVCTPGVLTCDLMSFQYATGGVKTVEVTVTVGGVPQPPIVHNLTVQATGSCGSFTGLEWVPVVPEIGQLTVFSVMGFTGPVRTEWDLGEDGCPGYPQIGVCDPVLTFCHDWAFKFASGGSKTVSVVVRDPNTNAFLGSATAHLWVEPTGSCDADAEVLFVTQSFYLPGAAGSIFRHEMALLNFSAEDDVMRIDWLPMGSDNTDPQSVVFPVLGGSAYRVDNVLDWAFSLDPGATGSLRIHPYRLSLQTSHLGLNTFAGDDYGSTIPVIEPADGLADGEVGHLPFLVENDDLRSNIHCVNMSTVAVSVALDLFATDGTWLDTGHVSLLPLSSGQLNRVFANHAPVVGYVDVSHAQPGALTWCSGMVVSNLQSNDSRIQPMAAPPNPLETFYLPRAVHDAESTTHLALFAPDGAAEARIDYLPTGQDNTSYASVVVPLADRQQSVILDVLDSLFSATGTGALRVVATSGAVVASAAETKEPSGLWMHRHAPLRPVGEQIPHGHPASIIHLTEDAQRTTDFGVVNTSGLTIDVSVLLRDTAGTTLGVREIQLLPFSHQEIAEIFVSIGHPSVTDGLARVWTMTEGGSFFAYAVVTELDTQDIWEMPAQLMPAELFLDGFETGDMTRWSSWSRTEP